MIGSQDIGSNDALNLTKNISAASLTLDCDPDFSAAIPMIAILSCSLNQLIIFYFNIS